MGTRIAVDRSRAEYFSTDVVYPWTMDQEKEFGGQVEGYLSYMFPEFSPTLLLIEVTDLTKVDYTYFNVEIHCCFMKN